MSLVGTRPILPDELEQYELHHRARIAIKVNFAPLLDKNNKKEKQAEFRNDVCSFANSDGGYIFYGIGETSGVALYALGKLIYTYRLKKFSVRKI